ncbi:cell division protein ZipA [Stieleria maiorica]|uniref:Cell division protein ZipA n=2 Tax=Stieleria maiorica TaxID=2795974 RepID=A0A5B9M9M1_9BACT|nr:cell division protein ZipA [Stieleria maiorica]
MPEDPFDNLYLSTNSESQARADRLLPSEGSEDASHVLGEWKPDSVAEDYDREEYLPDTSVEWVIDIEFPAAKTAIAKELSALFDESFRDQLGPCSLYGKDAKSGFWTFLISADGPESVTGLKVSYDYNRTWDSEFVPATASEYQARLDAVEEVVAKHIGDCNSTTSKSPSQAAQHAQSLSGLSDKYDQTVAICLVADQTKPFRGTEIWDVMLCLGLRWGDMDCFHWNNVGEREMTISSVLKHRRRPGTFCLSRLRLVSCKQVT